MPEQPRSGQPDPLDPFRKDVETRLLYGLSYDRGVEERWPERIRAFEVALDEVRRIRVEQPEAFEEACLAFHHSAIGRIAKVVAARMIKFMQEYGRWDGLTEYDRTYVSNYYEVFPHLRPHYSRGRKRELAPYFYDLAGNYMRFEKALRELKAEDRNLRAVCKRHRRMLGPMLGEMVRSAKLLVPWPYWDDMPQPPFTKDNPALGEMAIAEFRYMKALQKLIDHLVFNGFLPRLSLAPSGCPS